MDALNVIAIIKEKAMTNEQLEIICKQLNVDVIQVKKDIKAFGEDCKKATDTLNEDIAILHNDIYISKKLIDNLLINQAGFKEEIDNLNTKCKARNIRRKKTEAELQKEIDESVKDTKNLKLRMAQVATIQGHQGEEIEEIKQDVKELQEGQPTGKILTGFTMMKDRLIKELGLPFLQRTPQTEMIAKLDVKLCRDTLAEYYDNVNTDWPDADTRHFDAFKWFDPAGAPIGNTNEKIIDFMHDQEALKPIVDKWYWLEVE